MKKFKTQEIRDLYNQFFREEISFSRMVEIMNERVMEAEEPNFKEGDFLHSDWGDENITIIFKNQAGNNLYYHASKSCYYGVVANNDRYWRDEGDFRLATEEEKQELLDALAKKGKRWNAERLRVEDIPKKPKKGELAIFWGDNKGLAFIGKYDQFLKDAHYHHRDHIGNVWSNAVKFESVEQFKKLLKGEI